ncbi:MAG: hypothetical protein ACFCD0_15090 [Gemmataceae bacterium]
MDSSPDSPTPTNSTPNLSESVASEQVLPYVPQVPSGQKEPRLTHSIPYDVVTDQPKAMDVFLAWEKLRVIYNGIVFAVPLLFSIIDASRGHDFVRSLYSRLLKAILLANVCFCCGPVLEGYIVWLFKADRKLCRKWLFLGGFLMSLVMVCGLLCLVAVNRF